MTQLFRIHPKNPQIRLLKQAIAILREEGGVIAYPTDSGYALGCLVGNKDAIDRIRKIRHLDENHNFTLVCRDLSELSIYAKVSNLVFRQLKSHTPGPYTFILPATKEVPKRLQHPKRKTIGLRIPDNNITLALLKELDEPMMSVTLILPKEQFPIANAEEIYAKLDNQTDVILDGGFCGNEATTIVDFVSNEDGAPKVIRIGKGDATPFLPASGALPKKNTFAQVFEKLR